MATNLTKFADDVLEALNGTYTLRSGIVVQGQSLSFIKSHLRDRHWKNVSDYFTLMETLEAAGFSLARGRGERWYAGGKMGLGVECDVVYI